MASGVALLEGQLAAMSIWQTMSMTEECQMSFTFIIDKPGLQSMRGEASSCQGEQHNYNFSQQSINF